MGIEAARPDGAAEQWVGDLLLGVSRLRNFCQAHAHGMEGTSVKTPGARSAPPSRKLQLASPSRPSRGRTISGRHKAVRTLQSTSENKVGVLAAPDMRADVLNYLLPGETFTVSEELVIGDGGFSGWLMDRASCRNDRAKTWRRLLWVPWIWR